MGSGLGGGFALLLAADRGFDASSVNSGAVPKDAVELLADACPIVGSYGAHDPTLRGDADRLAGALAANGIDHDVAVYPDAGHSFLNDHDPAEAPLWSLVMGKLSTSEYHDESAVKGATPHRGVLRPSLEEQGVLGGVVAGAAVDQLASDIRMSGMARCLFNHVSDNPAEREPFPAAAPNREVVHLGIGHEFVRSGHSLGVERDDAVDGLTVLDPEVRIRILLRPRVADGVPCEEVVEPPPFDVRQVFDEAEQTRSRSNNGPARFIE